MEVAVAQDVDVVVVDDDDDDDDDDAADDDEILRLFLTRHDDVTMVRVVARHAVMIVMGWSL
jgi:hypothetical protein